MAAWRIVPGWADVPALSHPLGTGWIEALADARLAAAGRLVALVASGALLLGVRARWAAGVLALLGLYLLGLAQLRGPVQHTHHLVWFAALLAVSPCDRAFAVERGPSAGSGALTSLRAAWVLLACIYFFPGLHKLVSQGPAWAGEHLRLTLYWKWAQAWGFVPLTRIDRQPTLLWLGGLGVLALELGAPLLLWDRWTRMFFALAALAFHAATALWMDIHFWHLAPMLVVLLPFPTHPTPQDLRRATGGEDAPGDRTCTAHPSARLAVVSVLVAGAVLAGVTKQTQAWPFACYPTFDRTIGPWMPTLAVRLQPSGELLGERLLADPEHSQAFYARAWALAGHYGVRDPTAAGHFWGQVRRRPGIAERLDGVTRVEVHAAWLHVDPDDDSLRLDELLWAGEP